MALTASAVSVGTSATLITTGTGASTFQGRHGGESSALIHNNGNATVFLGGSGVTTAAGLPLLAGEKVSIGEIAADDAVYGIVASGTVEVRVLGLI